jgi:hypothetical protein
MNAGDVISDWRRNVNEPNTNRFTVQDSIDFLNKACIQAAMDIQFPEGTWTFNTVANQQEYAMLENLGVKRVYILGTNGTKQLIEPTDIPTMEGENQNIYDASSSFIPGQPILTPQWIAQPPASYPVNAFGKPQRYGHPTSLWTFGDPPRWYYRGGNIGFVPTPNGVFEVVIDLVPVPPIVTSTSSLLEFPVFYRDILVNKMSEYSRQADGSQASVMYNKLYMEQVTKQRRTLDERQLARSTVFMPWIRRNPRRRWGYGGY